jgi:hypothetical protein
MPGIRRLWDKSGGIGMISSGSAEHEIAYCQRCLEMANVRSNLGDRIYFPDKFGHVTIPPDADKWRQCHRCGSIYARYEVKQEAELDSLVKPGGPNTGLITGVPVRKFDRTGKGGSYAKKRKREQDLSQYKEEDLKAELRRGAKLISYHDDMA